MAVPRKGDCGANSQWVDTGLRYTHIFIILRITVIDRLPEDAQTLHAETLALLLANKRERNWSHLSGAFTTKRLKGADYVYFQYSDPGGTRRQFSVGRHSDALGAIITSYNEERASERNSWSRSQSPPPATPLPDAATPVGSRITCGPRIKVLGSISNSTPTRP